MIIAVSFLGSLIASDDRNQGLIKQELDLYAQKKLLETVNNIKYSNQHVSYRISRVNDAIENYLTRDVYSSKDLQAGVEFLDSMKRSNFYYENFIATSASILCSCCSKRDARVLYHQKIFLRSCDNATRALIEIKRD